MAGVTRLVALLNAAALATAAVAVPPRGAPLAKRTRNSSAGMNASLHKEKKATAAHKRFSLAQVENKEVARRASAMTSTATSDRSHTVTDAKAAQGVLMNFATKMSKVASADRKLLRQTGKAEAAIKHLLSGEDNEELRDDVMNLLDKARADERQVVASEKHEVEEAHRESKLLGNLASQRPPAPQQENVATHALLEGSDVTEAEDEGRALSIGKRIAKVTSRDKQVLSATQKATQEIEQVLSGEGDEQLGAEVADIMGKSQAAERKVLTDDSHILQVAREEARQAEREDIRPRPQHRALRRAAAPPVVVDEEEPTAQNGFAIEHRPEGRVDSEDRRTNLIDVRNEELKRLRFAAGEVRLAKKDQRLLEQVSEVDEEIQESLAAGDKEDAEAATEIRGLFGRAGSVLQKLAGRHQRIIQDAKRKIKSLVRYERQVREEEDEEAEEAREAEEHPDPDAEFSGSTKEAAMPVLEPKAVETEEAADVPQVAETNHQEVQDDNEVPESWAEPSSTVDEEGSTGTPDVAVQLEEEVTADRTPAVEKEAASMVAQQRKADRTSAPDDEEESPADDESPVETALLAKDEEDDVMTTSATPALDAELPAEADEADEEEHADAGSRSFLQEEAMLADESMAREGASRMAAKTSHRAAAQLHRERRLLGETRLAERAVRKAIRGGREAAQVRAYVTRLLEGTKRLEKGMIRTQKSVLRRARHEEERFPTE